MILDVIKSYLMQMNNDFKDSNQKRSSNLGYSVTRYFPTRDDFPLPASSNPYTLTRQVSNTLALALLLYNPSKETIVASLGYTFLLNAFLQHVVFPQLEDNNNQANNNGNTVVPR